MELQQTNMRMKVSTKASVVQVETPDCREPGAAGKEASPGVGDPDIAGRCEHTALSDLVRMEQKWAL